MGRRDEEKGGDADIQQRTGANQWHCASAGKKGRNSYNTFPSSIFGFFCMIFKSTSFCLQASKGKKILWLQHLVVCVTEQRAHPCLFFTFTTRTVSLLKILPSMQAQPPFSRHCYPHLSPFPRPDTASHQADANIRPPLTVPSAIARLYEADTCTAHTCMPLQLERKKNPAKSYLNSALKQKW